MGKKPFLFVINCDYFWFKRNQCYETLNYRVTPQVDKSLKPGYEIKPLSTSLNTRSKAEMGKRFRIPRNSVFRFPRSAENSRNGKWNSKSRNSAEFRGICWTENEMTSVNFRNDKLRVELSWNSTWNFYHLEFWPLGILTTWNFEPLGISNQLELWTTWNFEPLGISYLEFPTSWNFSKHQIKALDAKNSFGDFLASLLNCTWNQR